MSYHCATIAGGAWGSSGPKAQAKPLDRHKGRKACADGEGDVGEHPNGGKVACQCCPKRHESGEPCRAQGVDKAEEGDCSCAHEGGDGCCGCVVRALLKRQENRDGPGGERKTHKPAPGRGAKAARDQGDQGDEQGTCGELEQEYGHDPPPFPVSALQVLQCPAHVGKAYALLLKAHLLSPQVVAKPLVDHLLV